MSPIKLRTVALAVAGVASLLATAASAHGRPCTNAADCGGAYTPASSRYSFAPAHTATYAPPAQGGYIVGGAPATWGPALPPPPYAQGAPVQQGGYGYAAGGASYGYESQGYAAQGYAAQGYAAEGYAAQGGYAPAPVPVAGYPNPCAAPGCAPPPPPPVACGERCVPAYAFVPVPAPIHEVRLASDVYTGGVGVTDFAFGGGGGFNGNFEVQGFGDVSAFTSNKAVAWANADAYAKSLSYADASAKAYAKANASAQANVNISLKNTFFGGQKGGYMPGKPSGGCDTCGGGHPTGGYGGNGYAGKSWGYAPTPRGCTTCGGGGYGGKKH